jgi:hypothetical protein
VVVVVPLTMRLIWFGLGWFSVVLQQGLRATQRYLGRPPAHTTHSLSQAAPPPRPSRRNAARPPARPLTLLRRPEPRELHLRRRGVQHVADAQPRGARGGLLLQEGAPALGVLVVGVVTGGGIRLGGLLWVERGRAMKQPRPNLNGRRSHKSSLTTHSSNAYLAPTHDSTSRSHRLK